MSFFALSLLTTGLYKAAPVELRLASIRVERPDPSVPVKHAQVLVVEVELLCNRDGVFFPPTLPSYTVNRLYNGNGEPIKNLLVCGMPGHPSFYTPIKLFAGQTYEIEVRDPVKDPMLGQYRIVTESWFPKGMQSHGHKLWSWTLHLETTFNIDEDGDITIYNVRKAS